jgi:hypothetical protein
MLAQKSIGSSPNRSLATVINLPPELLADMFVLLENQRLAAEVAQSALH